MATLLPCPFCGADQARLQMIRDGRTVACGNCGASCGHYHHGPSAMPSANERAKIAWNTRTPSGLSLPESDSADLGVVIGRKADA